MSTETRAFCRKIFSQFDTDGNGEIKSEELVPLLTKLMRFMGIIVDDEVVKRIESEAPQVLETFDTDGNGILDFDEFVCMISQVAQESPPKPKKNYPNPNLNPNAGVPRVAPPCETKTWSSRDIR